MSPKTTKWAWPSEVELIEWEANARDNHKPPLGRMNVLKLVRAVRSQRKCIEKLSRLLADEVA